MANEDLEENEDSNNPWAILFTLMLALFVIFCVADTTLVLSIIIGAVLGTGVALAIGHEEMKSNHPLRLWNLAQTRIDEDEDENENEWEDLDECDYSLEILSTLQHKIPNMISTFVYSICIITLMGGLILILHF